MTVRTVRTVRAVPLVLVPCACSALRCRSERTGATYARHLASVLPEQRDAAIEKFIAARGGTPIIENQTRLVFFAKDKDGQTPRIVGDFNAWAVTPQGYDASIGKPTRIEGTSWSYLESTSYTNARLEYVFFYDKEAVPDPMNARTVQAYAGPRSEVRMPFWVAQPEVDELGSAPTGRGDRRDDAVAFSRRARGASGSTCRPVMRPTASRSIR